VSEQQKWAIDGQSQIRQQYENKCRETSQHVDKEKLQHSLAGSQSANDGQPRPEKNLDLKKSFLKVYRTKTEDMKI